MEEWAGSLGVLMMDASYYLLREPLVSFFLPKAGKEKDPNS